MSWDAKRSGNTIIADLRFVARQRIIRRRTDRRCDNWRQPSGFRTGRLAGRLDFGNNPRIRHIHCWEKKAMRSIAEASATIMLGSLTGALLTGQVTGEALAQGTSISIAGFKFSPDPVSAAPNTPVTWTNKDSVPHQIVIASKNLKTAVLNAGQSGQLTIVEAGTYDYVCGIHASMKGQIVVK
jgi:plastocyanin